MKKVLIFSLCCAVGYISEAVGYTLITESENVNKL